MFAERLDRPYLYRRWLLFGGFLCCMLILIWRLFDLQFSLGDFLRNHGDNRALRIVDFPVSRGVITDRHGKPLAVSTPVQSVWADPKQILNNSDTDRARFATLLDIAPADLEDLLWKRRQQIFVYIKRHISPQKMAQIKGLDLEGVYFQREYRRYYPAAEITSHLIGFTDIDDVGQEGLELAYDSWLQGSPGAKRVIKDRLGRMVDDIESIRIAKPGNLLTLSIDKRIQYLAYRELGFAVNQYQAKNGVLVMIDAKTGEVMAMVGLPSYNPNTRSNLNSDVYRNRLVTDVFEPGSTLKPFTILTAFESGHYTPQTKVDTSPGIYHIDGHTISDINNYGSIDMLTMIKKSSNIGVSKVALTLSFDDFLDCLSKIGFGTTTGSGYPGEVAGLLPIKKNFSRIEKAALAFGYGLLVTPLQLVQAYAILANDGRLPAITFTKVTSPKSGVPVIDPVHAREIRAMLEAVVSKDGTGSRAAIPGYRVAGKTGTVHKVIAGEYSEDRYLSSFVGFAPASDPKLVLLVMLDEPQSQQHFGGQVAAPVFAKVMSGALRLMDIPPDNLTTLNSPKVTLYQEEIHGRYSIK